MANRPAASTRIPDSPLDIGGLHPAPARPAHPARVTRYLPGDDPHTAPPPLRLRPAPAAPPAPTVLLTGDRGSGKTHELARLASCDRIHRAFLLEWGEADADLYTPTAGWDVLDHDGSWHGILGQIRAASAEAARTPAGSGPCVLLVDTVSAAWAQILAWAHDRARYSVKGQAVLSSDPDATVEVGFGGWQDAADRHDELLAALAGFPGPVVMTARGREAIDVDAASGTPTGRMVYKVDGHKALEHEAGTVIRLRNGAPPLVVKCVAPGADLNPTTEGPVELGAFSLEWLLFDVLGAQGAAPARRSRRLHRDPTPGQLHHQARQDAAVPPAPWIDPAPACDQPFDPATATEEQWLARVAQVPYDELVDLWRAAHLAQAPPRVLEALVTRGRAPGAASAPPKPARKSPARKSPTAKAQTKRAASQAAPAKGKGITADQVRDLFYGPQDGVLRRGRGRATVARSDVLSVVQGYAEAGGAVDQDGVPQDWQSIADAMNS